MVRMIAAAALAALAMGCSRESSQEPGVMRPRAPDAEERPAAPLALDPVAQVRDIYTPYLAGRDVKDILVAAPWMNDLHELLAKAIALGKDEPILDGDPIVDAQDWALSNLNVALEAPPESGRARVLATFTNLGQPREIHFDLVKIGDRWQVDNIRSGDWDLRKHLVAGIAAAEASPKTQ